jgi:transcription elongation factor GreA-like protein
MNGGIYGVLDEAIAFGKKLQKDEHDRLMSKKEDVVLEAVTEYAKNPDTYDSNIEVLKAQPDISYQNRQLVDKIANSYRTKKKTTKSEDNTLIKKEIASFDLDNVGEDSFHKFRQFKFFAVENDVFENPLECHPV